LPSVKFSKGNTGAGHERKWRSANRLFLFSTKAHPHTKQKKNSTLVLELFLGVTLERHGWRFVRISLFSGKRFCCWRFL